MSPANEGGDERTSLKDCSMARGVNIDDGDQHSMKTLFYVLIALLEVVGIACIILVAVWTNKYLGGYAWDGSGKEFNYHPVLMVIGLVFLYGNAAIMYRVLRVFPKYPVKLVHGSILLLAAICTIVGLVAVFDFHNHNKIPNLYSLHSWLGIATVVLFCCQYVAGGMVFLIPVMPASIRSFYLNIHVYFGVGMLPLVAVTCCSGITEKLLFSIKATYPQFAAAGIVANVLGVLIIAFVAIVLVIVLTPAFKRRPDGYTTVRATEESTPQETTP